MPSGAETQRAWPWMIGALALVTTCLVPTLQFELLDWDDKLHVTASRQGLLTPQLGYPVPVTVASYALDRALFGAAPWGFHLSQIVYQLIVCGLYLGLSRRLGLSAAAASLALVVFALHPATAEPVSWVSGRKDVLCALFGLAAVLLALSRARGAWPASVACYTLALLSKPSAAPLAVFAVVLPGLFGQRAPLSKASAAPQVLPGLFGQRAPLSKPSVLPGLFGQRAPLSKPSVLPGLFGQRAPLSKPSVLPGLFGQRAPLSKPSVLPGLFGQRAPLSKASAAPQVLAGLFGQRALLRGVPYLLVCLPIALLGVQGQASVGALSASDELVFGPRGIWYALGHHLSVAFLWQETTVKYLPATWPPGFIASVDLAPLVAAALFALALWAVRAAPALRRVVLLGGAFCLLTYLPSSGLFFSLSRFLADSYLYLPLMGAGWIAGAVLDSVRVRSRAALGVGLACALALVPCFVTSSARFADDEKLWSHALQRFPHHRRVCRQWANGVARKRGPDAGLQATDACIARFGAELFVRNRAVLLSRLGRDDEAQAWLRAHGQLSPMTPADPGTTPR